MARDYGKEQADALNRVANALESILAELKKAREAQEIMWPKI